MLKTLPTLVPNGFIYLHAKPDTCHRRLKKRAREEENTVGLDYLEVGAVYDAHTCGVGRGVMR